MKLEDFLVELRECPDKELKKRLGIYADNWAIFLNGDFGSFADELGKSNFSCYCKKEYPKPHNPRSLEPYDPTNLFKNYLFIYNPGIMSLSIFNEVKPWFTTGGIVNPTEKHSIESEKQLNNYNISIFLHDNYKKNILGVDRLRVAAIVIDELSQIFLREDIPCCMPRTMINEFNENADFSRIVYHQPK